MADELDLIVLTADADAEWTMRTLLERRYKAIPIREIRFKVVRHPNRDAGVYNGAPDFLRTYQGKAQHALILLDQQGSGAEHRKTSDEMEEDLEGRISAAGWERSRIRVIVLEPELEVWVWSSSPHVAAALGMKEPQLHALLRKVERDHRGKPIDPKTAMEDALRMSKKPLSSKIFQELASRVSLRVSERSFDRFREVVQSWFPVQG